MGDTPTTSLEIPASWGWYRPKEHLANILQSDLRGVLPEVDLISLELVAYHQDRNQVLLRRRDEPARVIVVHSNAARKKYAKLWPVVFEGTFSEFALREQKRFEIMRQTIEQPNSVPGVCPICFRAVVNERGSGIWTGSKDSKPISGPLYSATCDHCHALLNATPSDEASEAGVLFWDFAGWEDDAN